MSTWMPPLPAKNESSGDILQAIGRAPAHLMLFSSTKVEIIDGLCIVSTLTIVESSGSMSMTGNSSSCKTASISVKSAEEDWTIAIPVRSRANGSYRFSGPKGIGSISGSKGPYGE